MKVLKKILVITDFSDQAAYALRRAVDIATRTNAHITLLHVAQPRLFDKIIDEIVPAAKSLFITPKEYSAQLLKDEIHHLKNKKIVIEKVILEGKHAGIKILKYAKKMGFDLLVMGAHGKYTFHDSFVGTTAEYMAEKTTCPVLIVKAKPNHAYNHILIPIDFSPASKKALEFSARLFPKSKFRILHVGGQAYERLWEDEIKSSKRYQKLKKEIFLLLKNKTKEFVEKSKAKFSSLSFDVELGYAGIAIIEQAKKSKQNLICMGTKGHSRLHYRWMGRVACRVLIETDKDVLLIPPDEKIKN